jgi:tryptophan-rich hypothetical protein
MSIQGKPPLECRSAAESHVRRLRRQSRHQRFTQGARIVDSTNGFQPKPNRAALRLNAKKLLLTKWTATHPQNKEKHFIVTKLIEPDEPDAQIEMIEIEATYSKRVVTLPWRELTDEAQWRQGWK